MLVMKQVYVISEMLNDGTSQVLFVCKGDFDYLRRRIERMLPQFGARDFDQVQENGFYYFVIYGNYQEVWLRLEEVTYFND